MVVEVIGTEIKSGSFTDPKTGKSIDYNNLFLYCTKENTYSSEGSFGFGKSLLTVKIKNTVENVTSVFGVCLSADDLEGMIGQNYNVYYNEKQQVDSVTLFTPPVKQKKEA
ncbi:MAG: hypothetical protein HDT44_01105 [Ruminococcaceae bacterium]|nr:hypothetical protein [Oscillospiraceae bacterium]